MKRTIGIALVVLGLGAASASAQDGFDINYMDVGPVIGLGGINGAGFSVGGRFEKAIKELPAANGILGLSVGVDYYNFDNDVPFFDTFDFTVIPISVLVNYHFAIPSQPKLDVFAGAGLGYERWSFDCSESVFGVNFCDDLDGGGVFGAFHGGVRYFWRPKMAAFAEVTNYTGALTLGLMFKFGGN